MRTSSNTTALEQALHWMRAGRADLALPVLRELHRAQPDELPVLHALASALQRSGDADAAVQLYEAAIRAHPGDAAVLTAAGRAHLIAGRPDGALQRLRRALELDATRVDANVLLARLLRERGEPATAFAQIARWADAPRAHPELLWELAQSARDDARFEMARRACARLLERQPTHPGAQLALASVDIALGRFDDARERLRMLLRQDPTHAGAWAEWSSLNGDKLQPDELEQVTALAKTPGGAHRAAVLEDILARHHDRTGDHACAAVHVARANAANARHRRQTAPDYDPGLHAAEVDALIDAFSPRLIAEHRDSGVPDPRPVFVTGLPRSGTTLVEQRLALHPQALGLGELDLALHALREVLARTRGRFDTLTATDVRAAAERHLQALAERVSRTDAARSSRRWIDKQPDNYLQLGWLAIAFPRATLIHVTRDLRDVAASCWTTQFAHVAWSFDLDHIAHRIEQHQRLLAHWRRVLGARLVELRYEMLASDPDGCTRTLWRAAGLSDAVDAAPASSGHVLSASRVQVRAPIGTGSIGRWRRYADALKPILPRLEALSDRA